MKARIWLPILKKMMYGVELDYKVKGEQYWMIKSMFKDVDGKDIYESDKISYTIRDKKYISFIRFTGGKNGFFFLDKNHINKKLEHNLIEKYNLVVIGNKYEDENE